MAAMSDKEALEKLSQLTEAALQLRASDGGSTFLISSCTEGAQLTALAAERMRGEGKGNLWRTVHRVKVTRSLCNYLGTLHGGAQAALMDVCSTLALMLNSTGGVSSGLTISYVNAAPLDSEVYVISEVVAQGRRVSTIRCEIWTAAEDPNPQLTQRAHGAESGGWSQSAARATTKDRLSSDATPSTQGVGQLAGSTPGALGEKSDRTADVGEHPSTQEQGDAPGTKRGSGRTIDQLQGTSPAAKSQASSGAKQEVKGRQGDGKSQKPSQTKEDGSAKQNITNTHAVAGPLEASTKESSGLQWRRGRCICLATHTKMDSPVTETTDDDPFHSKSSRL